MLAYRHTALTIKLPACLPGALDQACASVSTAPKHAPKVAWRASTRKRSPSGRPINRSSNRKTTLLANLAIVAAGCNDVRVGGVVLEGEHLKRRLQHVLRVDGVLRRKGGVNCQRGVIDKLLPQRGGRSVHRLQVGAQNGGRRVLVLQGLGYVVSPLVLCLHGARGHNFLP